MPLRHVAHADGPPPRFALGARPASSRSRAAEPPGMLATTCVADGAPGDVGVHVLTSELGRPQPDEADALQRILDKL